MNSFGNNRTLVKPLKYLLMKIAKYISELLFEYECVVIPGLGGFITKLKPSQIHPVQHQFNPPSKKIVFNINLQSNDGLLINYIAQKENLTFVETRISVEKFVEKCMTEITNGKKFYFDKIGVLFMDKEKNILFEPEKDQNFLADSFGLKEFISPPIDRPIFKSSIRSAKTTIRKERDPRETAERENINVVKEPKQMRTPILFICLIAIICSLFILYRFNTVKKYYENYAGIIPFFYSSPNEYLISNLDKEKIMKVYSLIENLTSQKSNQIEKSSSSVKQTQQTITPTSSEFENLSEQTEKQPKTKIEMLTTPTIEKSTKKTKHKYYVIAGSFKEKANAEELVKRLNYRGFNAKIVNQNEKGFFRVCFDGFSNISEARQILTAIKREEEPQAWLLSF